MGPQKQMHNLGRLCLLVLSGLLGSAWVEMPAERRLLLWPRAAARAGELPPLRQPVSTAVAGEAQLLPPVALEEATPPAQKKPPAPAGEALPPPRPAEEPAGTSLHAAPEPWLAAAEPINLPAALRLALTANWDIAQAREAVNAARAARDRAEVNILPNLNIGSTYTKHDGNIAKTEGNIIKANKDALFVGGGPSLALALTDALFAPLVARQVLAARQAGLQRVSNDTLLAVGEAYVNVLRARRRLARIEETLDYLISERPSPLRAGSKGLLPVIQEFYKAEVVEAQKAEVERARVEVLRRQEERAAAVQEFLTATAELARLLRLDPQVPLWPVEDFRYPLPLPGARWQERPLEELARLALTNRPELAENAAQVQAALERLRAAQWKPFLPIAVLNYNWGDFGGGPDPIKGGGFGPSGRLRHFNTRDDFEASLIWRFSNLGLGDTAAMREEAAKHRQTVLRQRQLEDLVVTQVVQTLEEVRGWQQRVAVTRAALFDAQGAPRGPVFESLRLNFDRIRQVEKTRPLEVLDAIRGLNDTLEAYGQAISGYDRARFRLLIVLGLPPQEILRELLNETPLVAAQAAAPTPAAQP
jgi:outer membrane protein TolC